jgi:hypothetical protein
MKRLCITLWGVVSRIKGKSGMPAVPIAQTTDARDEKVIINTSIEPQPERNAVHYFINPDSGRVSTMGGGHCPVVPSRSQYTWADAAHPVGRKSACPPYGERSPESPPFLSSQMSVRDLRPFKICRSLTAVEIKKTTNRNNQKNAASSGRDAGWTRLSCAHRIP